MREVRLVLAVAVVGALTVFSGLWQGRLSHRWGASKSTLAAASKIVGTPESFGDWTLQSSSKLDKTALAQLECAGHFVRNYINKRTGDAVNVTLIVGPAGPTSVHRPEICLSSRSYTSRGDRRRLSVRASDGGADQFWSVDFQSTGVGGQLLRVCYAWSVGEGWAAPEDARFAFAGSPYLYKLQVSTVLHGGEDADKDTTISRFLQDFTAEARSHLVPPSRT
ncbi:MAG: EpsI family protein [Planctomycetaceae bacterium]|nr:EpsI family protein [Planctomycetaceae bacterium]